MNKVTKTICGGLGCLVLAMTSGGILAGCGEKDRHVSSTESFIEAVSDGGKIILDKDIVMDTNIIVTKDVCIDLNGKNITETFDAEDKNITALFEIRTGDAKMTVTGNGSITTDDAYIFRVGATKLVDDGDKVTRPATVGHLTIEDGSYNAPLVVGLVLNGDMSVLGGEYKVTGQGQYGTDYLLNLLNEAGKNGTAKIEVMGGKFHNYNPANSKSEDPAVSFVKDGYVSKESDSNGEKIYTVVRDTEE